MNLFLVKEFYGKKLSRLALSIEGFIIFIFD